MRSGVGAPLIRAWERRYGIVSPTRTDAGYRLYDDGMVAVLRAMRALIAAGWAPSQAARSIAAGQIPVDVWASRASGASPDRTGDGPTVSRLGPVSAFITGSTAYDVSAVEAALDDMFSRGSYEAVVDDLVLPAAAALGDEWAVGSLDVGSEHLGSAAIGRRLSGAFEAAAHVTSGPRIVVGLPPGARHELGALAFAVALRRRGLRVVYLGADVPLASWADAVSEIGAAAAVVGVVAAADVPAAEETRITLAFSRSSTLIAFGGRAASALTLNPDHREILLPHRVVDAAEAIQRSIGGARN